MATTEQDIITAGGRRRNRIWVGLEGSGLGRSVLGDAGRRGEFFSHIRRLMRCGGSPVEEAAALLTNLRDQDLLTRARLGG